MRIISLGAGVSAALLAVLAMASSCTGSGGGGGDDDGDDGGGDDGVGSDGLGPWTGRDRVAPSQDPPGGLAVKKVPLFVSFGWDDNGYSGLEGTAGTGGMTWALETFAGRKNKD